MKEFVAGLCVIALLVLLAMLAMVDWSAVKIFVVYP